MADGIKEDWRAIDETTSYRVLPPVNLAQARDGTRNRLFVHGSPPDGVDDPSAPMAWRVLYFAARMVPDFSRQRHMFPHLSREAAQETGDLRIQATWDALPSTLATVAGLEADDWKFDPGSLGGALRFLNVADGQTAIQETQGRWRLSGDATLTLYASPSDAAHAFGMLPRARLRTEVVSGAGAWATLAHDNVDPAAPVLEADGTRHSREAVEPLLKGAVRLELESEPAQRWVFTRAGQFVRIADQDEFQVYDPTEAVDLIGDDLSPYDRSRFFGPERSGPVPG